MLFKLVVARCINTGLLIYLATDYNAMFDSGTLSSIQNILIADAITTPLFRLLNIYDYALRYIYGPMTAETQEEYDVFLFFFFSCNIYIG